MSWQRGRRAVDFGDWDQLRADVGKRWKKRINTADIAKELNVREADVERALHQILNARFSVNTVLGSG
jgi:hypothetical protein